MFFSCKKKQGVPWDCFSELQIFAVSTDKLFDNRLIKFNRSSDNFILSIYTSSTIHTNRMHHLHSTLSTDGLIMYDHKVVVTDLIIRWS